MAACAGAVRSCARTGAAVARRSSGVRRSVQPAAALLGALAVLVVLAVISAVPSASQSDPSSRAAGKLGTLALYSWFDRLGLPVHRVTGTFSLVGTDVLIEYDPETLLTNSEVDSVIAYLDGGGDVVLAVTPGSQSDSLANAAELLHRLGVDTSGTVAAGTGSPAQPFDSSDRVHAMHFGGAVSFSSDENAVPLIQENGAAVVAALRSGGGGRVYLLGDTLPLSNEGLRQTDDRWFALALLERARGGRIGFDEYHHGEQSASTSGAGAIFNGPIGLATALAFALALLFLGLNGRRMGKPVADVAAVVPSAATYVAALGQLFSRSRRRGSVAARYADELKRRVGAGSGVDEHFSDSQFVAELSATGTAQATALADLLARARALAAGAPTERDILMLARDVDAFERSWAQPTDGR